MELFHFFNAVICLEDADGMAKRADHDQTAPSDVDLQCLLRPIYTSQHLVLHGVSLLADRPILHSALQSSNLYQF